MFRIILQKADSIRIIFINISYLRVRIINWMLCRTCFKYDCCNLIVISSKMLFCNVTRNKFPYLLQYKISLYIDTTLNVSEKQLRRKQKTISRGHHFMLTISVTFWHTLLSKYSK